MATETPVKKKRGRPKGSKNKPKDPAVSAGNTANAPKKRGRPKGSKNKKPAASTSPVKTTADKATTDATADKAASTVAPMKMTGKRDSEGRFIYDPNSHWHCPKCEYVFRSSRLLGHCGACHETFMGQGAYDEHRTGKHGADRRCMTTEELHQNLWVDPDGCWRAGEWKDIAAERLRKVERGKELMAQIHGK